MFESFISYLQSCLNSNFTFLSKL